MVGNPILSCIRVDTHPVCRQIHNIFHVFWPFITSHSWCLREFGGPLPNPVKQPNNIRTWTWNKRQFLPAILLLFYLKLWWMVYIIGCQLCVRVAMGIWNHFLWKKYVPRRGKQGRKGRKNFSNMQNKRD